MNKTTRLGAVMLVLTGALLAGAAVTGETGTAADEKAIRQTVQFYFDGIIKYDEDSLRKAFHPDAYVSGIDKSGKLDREPFQEWVLYTRGDAPDPNGRNNAILSIDIVGEAAVAKTELDWPHVLYTDYLSLLKIDGEWKIVGKIWDRADPKKR